MSMTYSGWSYSRYNSRPVRYFPMFTLVELTIALLKEFLFVIAYLIVRLEPRKAFDKWVLGEEFPEDEARNSLLQTLQERNQTKGTPWCKPPHMIADKHIKHEIYLREMKRKQEKLERLLIDVRGEEKAAIIKWVIENDLNEYGDFKYTGYGSGFPGRWGPLVDPSTGLTKRLYEYLVENHPYRPWLNEKRAVIRRMLKDQDPAEVSAITEWIIKNNHNEYGEPLETQYPAKGPLSNMLTGESLTLYEYLCGRNPDKPWLDTLKVPGQKAATIDKHAQTPTQQFDYILSSRPAELLDAPQLLEDVSHLLDS